MTLTLVFSGAIMKSSILEYFNQSPYFTLLLMNPSLNPPLFQKCLLNTLVKLDVGKILFCIFLWILSASPICLQIKIIIIIYYTYGRFILNKNSLLECYLFYIIFHFMSCLKKWCEITEQGSGNEGLGNACHSSWHTESLAVLILQRVFEVSYGALQHWVFRCWH